MHLINLWENRLNFSFRQKCLFLLSIDRSIKERYSRGRRRRKYDAEAANKIIESQDPARPKFRVATVGRSIMQLGDRTSGSFFSPRDLVNETKANRRSSPILWLQRRRFLQPVRATYGNKRACIVINDDNKKQKGVRRDASMTRVTHRLLNRRSCPYRCSVRYRSPENTYT